MLNLLKLVSDLSIINFLKNKNLDLNPKANFHHKNDALE